MRYLLVLGMAAFATVLFWPYLRKLDPGRRGDRMSKGGTVFFAVAIAVALSFALSALLYLLAL